MGEMIGESRAEVLIQGNTKLKSNVKAGLTTKARSHEGRKMRRKNDIASSHQTSSFQNFIASNFIVSKLRVFVPRG